MDWWMAPEAAAVLLVVAVGATALYFAIPAMANRTRGASRPRQPAARGGASWGSRIAADLRVVRTSEPGDQLTRVMAAPFAPKRIMSKSEYDVFRVVEREIAVARGGHRVFAQTCLGEILTSPDPAAFASINAKRTDILVVGPTGLPCFAVEYQGEGHHQSQAAARDAVKKEALRKAGIGYVEILPTHTLEDRQNLIRIQLRLSIDRPG